MNQAEVIRVVDGDTLECQGILSFHHEDSNLMVRIKDLYTFEIRKPSDKILDRLEPELKRLNLKSRKQLITYMKELGQHCKLAMENLTSGERLIISSYPENMSFNRWVAEVWKRRDGVNLQQWMIDEKFGQIENPTDQAKPYLDLLLYWRDRIYLEK